MNFKVNYLKVHYEIMFIRSQFEKMLLMLLYSQNIISKDLQKSSKIVDKNMIMWYNNSGHVIDQYLRQKRRE